ncbi:MAG TPA: hypothetical protein PK819_11665, partial [Thermomicrobiales bacterium]|nr:hypothetical protein [Thermomicrobiales bacterium]
AAAPVYGAMGALARVRMARFRGGGEAGAVWIGVDPGGRRRWDRDRCSTRSTVTPDDVLAEIMRSVIEPGHAGPELTTN